MPRRLAFILPVTIGLIFGLLFLMFVSMRRAGLVLVNVPSSIAGGVLMLSAPHKLQRVGGCGLPQPA